MSQINMSSDRIHHFNQITLALDKELGLEFEIDLLIMPEEARRNSIVAKQWHTSGAKNVCPLCRSLDGQIFPVDSPEYSRIVEPLHQLCHCVSSYITARERGVEARIKKYKPIDPKLLKKWSSKLYTKAEIAEMVKLKKEFIPEEEI